MHEAKIQPYDESFHGQCKGKEKEEKERAN